MSVRTLLWVAIGLWVAAVAAAALLFVRGMTVPSSDRRQAVVLAPAERDAVLAEMRTMLGSVQGVIAGVNAQDAKRVAQAARASGMAMAVDTDPVLMAKLPLAFKQLGIEAHKAFDELAATAESGASAERLLAALDTQLGRCVACHAAYRLEAMAKK